MASVRLSLGKLFDETAVLVFLGHSFSGSYDEYFGLPTDTESFNYLQLANHVSQMFYPESITIAEVSLLSSSLPADAIVAAALLGSIRHAHVVPSACRRRRRF